MTAVEQNIGADPNSPYISGDTLDLDITISTVGFDLASASQITWRAFKSAGSKFTGAALVEKTLGNGISVTSATEMTISISPTDSNDLAGTYYHECEIVLTGGAVHTAFVGTWTIRKDGVT